MVSSRYDLVIIGGGIVGMATAMTLLDRLPHCRMAVLEKESGLALHQSGHNSGVIHSGIYYAPGSLKARLCVQGVGALLHFADRSGIPYELCGKLIIATRENEIPRLKELWQRGITNGVKDLEWIEKDRIRAIEPHAAGMCAIHSRRTGIIHFPRAVEAMAGKFQAQGGEVITGAKVERIIDEGRMFRISAGGKEIHAAKIINCAGLHSDYIARLMGYEPNIRIIPFRGEYFKLRKDRRHLVRNLIYPVPDPNLPFLGVHFTRMLDGEVKAGPNAVLALAREGYQKSDFVPRETLDMMTHFSFWRMALRHWRTGLVESSRSLIKPLFVRALQRLVPEIREQDLGEEVTGVRAQCVDMKGNLVQDFKIECSRRAIHVFNVPSPAATACLTIADSVASLARQSLGLGRTARTGNSYR